MSEFANGVKEPPSLRRRLIWVGVVLAFVALIAGGLAFDEWQQGRETAQEEEQGSELPEMVRVIYEVEGDGQSFDMTATTPTGTQQATAELPLRAQAGQRLGYDFWPGDFVYLSAQSKQGFTITCRISADGVVISENTSTGRFGIATCEGTARLAP